MSKPSAAYELLRRAEYFRLGGVSIAGTTPDEQIALYDVLADYDARDLLLSLLEEKEGSTEGKLYALLGLRVLDRALFEDRVARLRFAEGSMVTTQGGCIIETKMASAVLAALQEGQYDRWLEDPRCSTGLGEWSGGIDARLRWLDADLRELCRDVLEEKSPGVWPKEILRELGSEELLDLALQEWDQLQTYLPDKNQFSTCITQIQRLRGWGEMGKFPMSAAELAAEGLAVRRVIQELRRWEEKGIGPMSAAEVAACARGLCWLEKQMGCLPKMRAYLEVSGHGLTQTLEKVEAEADRLAWSGDLRETDGETAGRELAGLLEEMRTKCPRLLLSLLNTLGGKKLRFGRHDLSTMSIAASPPSATQPARLQIQSRFKCLLVQVHVAETIHEGQVEAGLRELQQTGLARTGLRVLTRYVSPPMVVGRDDRASWRNIVLDLHLGLAAGMAQQAAPSVEKFLGLAYCGRLAVQRISPGLGDGIASTRPSEALREVLQSAHTDLAALEREEGLRPLHDLLVMLGDVLSEPYDPPRVRVLSSREGGGWIGYGDVDLRWIAYLRLESPVELIVQDHREGLLREGPEAQPGRDPTSGRERKRVLRLDDVSASRNLLDETWVFGEGDFSELSGLDQRRNLSGLTWIWVRSAWEERQRSADADRDVPRA